MYMNLDIAEWKEFKLGDLFTPKYGVNLELTNCTLSTSPDAINFVARTSENNGVVARVEIIEGIKPQKAGSITCAGGGSVLSTFVQTKDFYSGRDLYLLIPNEEISLEAKLFCCTVITQNKYRYNYGRQANKTLKELLLKLPAVDNKPDWDYMEKYIKELRHKPITTSVSYKVSPAPLQVSKWEEYQLGDLFNIEKGKRLTKADMIEGTDNYLGAIDNNNGVRQKILAERLWKPNCITVNYNGSVGEAFYQSDPFWASDDVNVLYPNGWELNKYIGLFIATIIKAERPKYNYGRKWKKEVMKKSVIKLPSKNSKPDWDYMESYMKSLSYSDRI